MTTLKRLCSKPAPVFAIIILITVNLITVNANAQQISWYVDNALANGNNDGTSWANAWHSFAAVNWANIRPGNTLYISGGATAGSKTYTENFTVGASGTSGSRITITIDTANASHNGTVIFDYDADRDNSSRTGILINRSYITVDGTTGNHIQLRNLRNILTRNSASAIAGGGTGLLFDHITFTNVNNGLTISPATNLEVRNCRFEQIRGDRAIFASTSGTWDSSRIHDNYIETMTNTSTPPGGSGSYVGPDGIQGGSGISIYNNDFKHITTSVYTSNQHPDMLQMQGNYIKVYGNRFTNVGDSVFDYDAYSNANPHDIRVYNNIFRILTPIDPYPEYFRFYASANSIASITNVKILNNDFVDNTGGYRAIRFDSFGGNPTGTGNEIKNNIFYNVGNGTSSDPIINIDNSTGFTPSSFSFDANIYYQPGRTQYITFRGTSYTAANWVAHSEPKGKSGQGPAFLSYTAFANANDYHLQAADSVAKDAGVDLSANFSSDKDGVTRPQGVAWDGGAYEFTAEAAPKPPTGLTVTVQ